MHPRPPRHSAGEQLCRTPVESSILLYWAQGEAVRPTNTPAGVINCPALTHASTYPFCRRAPEKLRAYLEYVKGTLKPSVSPVAQSVLVAYYSNQRQANTYSEGRTTIRLLESTVRLAQAHARLMYQAEVTLRDAIYVVLLMEASTHQAKVIPNLSALHSRFDDDPDATYPFLRDIVLSNLGLDVDGNPLAPSRGGRGGS